MSGSQVGTGVNNSQNNVSTLGSIMQPIRTDQTQASQPNLLTIPPGQSIVSSGKNQAKRIFISGANSLLGHALFDQLRNDHLVILNQTEEEEHKFYVTANQKDINTMAMPSQSMRVLHPKQKPKNFKKRIQGSDWIVIDLLGAALSGQLEEIEYVLKILKDTHSSPQPDQKEQTLVLVSSVMSWANTNKKLKKNFPKKPTDDDPADALREDESETEDDPANSGNKVLYF